MYFSINITIATSWNFKSNALESQNALRKDYRKKCIDKIFAVSFCNVLLSAQFVTLSTFTLADSDHDVKITKIKDKAAHILVETAGTFCMLQACMQGSFYKT